MFPSLKTSNPERASSIGCLDIGGSSGTCERDAKCCDRSHGSRLYFRKRLEEWDKKKDCCLPS
jgi:hypothetical protein